MKTTKYDFKSVYGEKLLQHANDTHDIQINVYKDEEGVIQKVAVECMFCGEVIIDSNVLELLEYRAEH